jgi:hypothetical protein
VYALVVGVLPALRALTRRRLQRVGHPHHQPFDFRAALARAASVISR